MGHRSEHRLGRFFSRKSGKRQGDCKTHKVSHYYGVSYISPASQGVLQALGRVVVLARVLTAALYYKVL